MINDFLLRNTKREEWLEMQKGILGRIQATMGTSPVDLKTDKNCFQVMDEYEKYGLCHLRIRYQVLEDQWNEGICIVPKTMVDKNPAVLVMHGTNGILGKYGMLDKDKLPDRAYSVELAQRGYVTFAVDQFGFGDVLKTTPQEELIQKFYNKYPKWSLDGYRLLQHIRALDVLEQLDFVDREKIGVIGHSLGGRSVIYLSVFDRRIKSAVCSTGISPNYSNVFRSITRDRLLSPVLSEQLEKEGKAPWEYNEMIALCAPCALLIVEPFDDQFNPDSMGAIQCVHSAHMAYRLLECPERLTLMVHGDRHDTKPYVRETAYGWFDRFLSLDNNGQ